MKKTREINPLRNRKERERRFSLSLKSRKMARRKGVVVNRVVNRGDEVNGYGDVDERRFCVAEWWWSQLEQWWKRQFAMYRCVKELCTGSYCPWLRERVVVGADDLVHLGVPTFGQDLCTTYICLGNYQFGYEGTATSSGTSPPRPTTRKIHVRPAFGGMCSTSWQR